MIVNERWIGLLIFTLTAAAIFALPAACSIGDDDDDDDDGGSALTDDDDDDDDDAISGATCEQACGNAVSCAEAYADVIGIDLPSDVESMCLSECEDTAQAVIDCVANSSCEDFLTDFPNVCGFDLSEFI